MPQPEEQSLEVEQGKRGRISAIWFVPILAAIVGAAVMWQSFSSQGPTVEIRFNEAKGIEAGKTEIKHKDVVIGLVEEVKFSDDLDSVLVSAQLNPEIEPFLGDTTQFWVVGAAISGTDLSGLGTILSGSYIEVDWSGTPNQSEREFVGLETRPLTPPGAEGRQIEFRSGDAGSIDVGSAIYFRGLNVGRIESRKLSDDFQTLEYTGFVEAPYADLINQNSRFWNVSGVALTSGAEGISVQVSSLSSLVSGGVAFGQVGNVPIDRQEEFSGPFSIYANLSDAEESLYSDPGQTAYSFSLVFDESVNGLEPGAPVEWQGIRIGTVSDLQLDLAARASGDTVKVIIELQPSRLGLSFENFDEAMIGIEEWVRSGMRVRLATGNILTGKKLIRFVDEIGDKGQGIDFSAEPFPRLPTALSDLDAAADNAEAFIATLADLPLNELVDAMVRVLENANTVIADPALTALPGELNQTLSSFDRVAISLDAASKDLPTLINSMNAIANTGEETLSGLSPDSELYIDLANSIRELRDASRSLSALAARLEEQPNALIMGRN